MATSFLVLDVASAGLANAADYLKPAAERRAPKNYTKPESILAWQQEDFADDLAKAGLDLDLARMTGVGYVIAGSAPYTEPCKTEAEEAALVTEIGKLIDSMRPTIVTYNGHDFDLLLLMRRARYLGVWFPPLNLDRYKSPHLDLMELLSNRNPQRRKPLGFWVKRHGWTDLRKPLSGEEEARVPETGRWAELEASLYHDVTATYRLAQWWGVVPRVPAEAVA